MEKDALRALPNIGKAVAGQLRESGIDSPEELCRVGAREAWLRILTWDDSACYNRLLGLEGAVRGVPKAALPQAVRDELKAFYRQAKAPSTGAEDA